MLPTLKNKIFEALLTMLVTITVGITGAAPALAEDNASKNHRFEQNLERLAAANPEAAENLAKFRALTAEEQAVIEQGGLFRQAAKAALARHFTVP